MCELGEELSLLVLESRESYLCERVGIGDGNVTIEPVDCYGIKLS